MSIGEGAKAVLVENGETDVVYQYGGYTLNDPAHREYALDGKITILQQCFAGDLKKNCISVLARLDTSRKLQQLLAHDR